MVTRVLVKCSGCGERLVLRVQISTFLDPDVQAGVQPFLFACPSCRINVHGRLLARPLTPDVFSDDFEILDEHETGSEQVVSVATDLPVAISLSGPLASQPLLTPYIHLTSSLGLGAFELMESIGLAQRLRDTVFSALRRATNAYAHADPPGVTRALLPVLGDPKPSKSADPTELLRRVFVDIFAPIGDPTALRAASNEAAKIVEAARQVGPVDTANIFTELGTGTYREHRRRCLDVAMDVLDDVNALFPAMWAELMSGRLELSDYRVMRDDFGVLKIRYQDIFELGSRNLAFLAPFANVVQRRRADLYVDGKQRSQADALNRTRAFDREAWLAELPAARALYEKVNRHTRNDIGHALVRYDIEAGALAFDDGSTENYLEFLGDYLAAARLTHYLVECVFILDRG